MDDPVGDDVARGRWMAINTVRVMGAAMVVFGILIVTGKLPRFPEWAGYVVVALGLFETFAMPQILARKWRSPRK